MRPTPESSTQEVLAGLVERVTFHNAENGFCVLRAKARGHRDLVTVVGHAAIISAGEWITASGEWTNDRTHGQQFKARFLKTSAPSSIEGIEKYLGSGMIRGIGPIYAKKIKNVSDNGPENAQPTRAGNRAQIQPVVGLISLWSQKLNSWRRAMDSNHRFGLPYHAVTILPETCARYGPRSRLKLCRAVK